MLRIGCCFLLALATLTAADVSGKWSGTLTTPDGGTQGAYFNLRQDGESLTGTTGPSAEKQWAIQKGKVQGKRLSFEVAMPGGGVMKFDLTSEGDRLEGEMRFERNGEREAYKLSVTRVT